MLNFSFLLSLGSAVKGALNFDVLKNNYVLLLLKINVSVIEQDHSLVLPFPLAKR